MKTFTKIPAALALACALATPALAGIEEDIAAAATGFKQMAGADIGNGVTIRDARAAGTTLEIDATFTVVDPAKVPKLADSLRGNINAAYCASGGRDFYAKGGALRIRAFDTAGTQLTDTTLTSCDN